MDSRKGLLLKIACLILTLIQIRNGNKFGFPTLGIKMFCIGLPSQGCLATALIYFAGIMCLIIAIATHTTKLERYFFISGFVLLLLEIIHYQYIVVPECHWDTSIYLWMAIPFIVLGLIQLLSYFTFMTNKKTGT
jgi:hypothetical protein